MPDYRHIVLTGFMGTGKSSVGRRLAELTGFPFVDMDEIITANSGMSISAIFARYGETAFRLQEREALLQALSCPASIIATGGGAVIDPGNRKHLRQQAVVINITAPLSSLLSRLKGDTSRPLLTGENPEARMRSLLEEREHFYADADIRIDTDDKSVEDVAAEIMAFLKRHSG